MALPKYENLVIVKSSSLYKLLPAIVFKDVVRGKIQLFIAVKMFRQLSPKELLPSYFL